MQLTSEQIQKIKDYLLTKPLTLAYLFGSQVKGQTKKSSDVDIAVLFNDNLDQSQKFDLRLDLMHGITKIAKNKNVDVVPIDQAPLLLKYDILRDNLELVNNNKAASFAFRFETIHSYLDSLFFRKRGTQISLSRFAELGLQ